MSRKCKSGDIFITVCFPCNDMHLYYNYIAVLEGSACDSCGKKIG